MSEEEDNDEIKKENKNERIEKERQQKELENLENIAQRTDSVARAFAYLKMALWDQGLPLGAQLGSKIIQSISEQYSKYQEKKMERATEVKVSSSGSVDSLDTGLKKSMDSLDPRPEPKESLKLEEENPEGREEKKKRFKAP